MNAGAWVDALPDQGRAVVPGPGHLRRVADPQEQVELLGEERVVVGEGVGYPSKRDR